MTMPIRCLGALTLVIVVAVFSTVAQAAMYDLKSDWSDDANPFGAWALYKSPTALFTINQNPFSTANPTQRAWADQPFPEQAHVPVWMKSVSDGMIYAHSAEWDRTGTNITFARWTSPETGLATINGFAWNAETVGRTTRWEIRINGTAVTGADLYHDNTSWTLEHPFAFADGYGGQSALSFDVQVGNTVDLVLISVNESGNLGDSLGLDMVIGVVPEPTGLSLALISVVGLASRRAARRSV